MKTFELSYAADQDLQQILRYTHRAWGAAQSEKYYRDFVAKLSRVAEKPHLGRVAADVSGSIRKILYGAHVVYYEPIPTGILILRVLHQHMDQLGPLTRA